MADAASRRAARRKRILENSDDRMKKLLGTYGKENEDEDRYWHAEEQPNVDQPPREEQQAGKENTESVRDGRLQISSPDTPADDASAFSLLPESDQATATDRNYDGSGGENDGSGLRLRINQNSNLTETGRTENQRDQGVKNSETPPEQQTLHTKQSLKRRTDVNKTAEDVESAHHTAILRLRVMLFLVAAVIVRLVLLSGFGILYIQSTVLPFFLVEASFLMYLSSSPEGILNSFGKPGGSLLTSALMLSGIQPQVITSYTNISTIFSTCFEDFAVYFFSFIMTHSLVQCFE